MKHWLTFINLITHTRHEDEQSVWTLFVFQWCTTDTFIFSVFSRFMLSKQILIFCDLCLQTIRKLWLHVCFSIKNTRRIASRLPEMTVAHISFPVPQNFKYSLTWWENVALVNSCLWGLHLSYGSRRISESQPSTPLLSNNTQACMQVWKKCKPRINKNHYIENEKKIYLSSFGSLKTFKSNSPFQDQSHDMV